MPLLTFFDRMKVKKLLLQLGKTNVSVSGDTRFDVATILEK
jgi:3-deoxy-D-manno-octulosonic-acid transferase